MYDDTLSSNQPTEQEAVCLSCRSKTNYTNIHILTANSNIMQIIVISTSLLLQWQLILVYVVIIQQYEQNYIYVLYNKKYT